MSGQTSPSSLNLHTVHPCPGGTLLCGLQTECKWHLLSVSSLTPAPCPRLISFLPPLASPQHLYTCQELCQLCCLHSGLSTFWPICNMLEGSRSLWCSSGNPRPPHLMCLMWERMRRSWARRRCCCCRVRPALAIRWIKVSVILSKTRWIWSFSSRDFRVLDRNVYTPECARRQ